MIKVGFLGPEGTFTEEALLSVIPKKGRKFIPFSTEADVIQAVDKGLIDKGIVPIENSIEGPVNVTLDMLAFEANVYIEKEISQPVRQNLIARKGVRQKDIKIVYSHPQATAQCRNFISKNLPRAQFIATNSTGEAVKKAAENTTEPVAAIGSKLASEIYGLNILATDIEDYRENVTRFVLLGKGISKRTGHDKTSIVCTIHEDRPGALLQILQEFAYRYINLTKIASRPTKKELGRYVFFIDMEGHINDTIIEETIKCLRCKIKSVKFLGSYPRG